MTTKQAIIYFQNLSRGFHLVTDDFNQHNLICSCECGIANLFMMHTSASLSINENSDRLVREDFETFTNALVPQSFPHFKHTYEGLDDMPAHIKSSLYGASLTIPISKGALALGTWQGVYCNEHRDRGHRRGVTLTVMGEFSR